MHSGSLPSTLRDRLLKEAHARGLHIILDYVPNHTSDQHPWFLESRRSRHNPRKDWYIWADSKSDGSPPNNWLSVFGGPAWSWDPIRKQYYLHSFLPQQPDLNWRHPEVRAAMLEILRFWLERGVDGFRIDVAHFLMKDPYLRDNPPNPSRTLAFWRSFGSYDNQLHLFDQGHPDVHYVHRELRQLLDSYSRERPRVCIGEIYRPTAGEWATYYGRDLDELHLPFNFLLLTIPWTAQDVRRIVDEVEAALPTGAWPNYVLGNHDEPRVVSRLGPRQARVAMLLLLTLRGTPTLYYGDELGMQNVPIAAEHIDDRWERNMPGLNLGRDQERAPMMWEASVHADFCPSDTEPWLPMLHDAEHRSVAEQLADPSSMLSLTRQLLMMRRSHLALALGSYRSVHTVEDDCFVYLRQYGSQCVLVALNFAQEERRLNVAEFETGHILLSTQLDRKGPINLTHLTLHGDEGCIIAASSKEACSGGNTSC